MKGENLMDFMVSISYIGMEEGACSNNRYGNQLIVSISYIGMEVIISKKVKWRLCINLLYRYGSSVYKFKKNQTMVKYQSLI